MNVVDIRPSGPSTMSPSTPPPKCHVNHSANRSWRCFKLLRWSLMPSSIQNSWKNGFLTLPLIQRIIPILHSLIPPLHQAPLPPHLILQLLPIAQTLLMSFFSFLRNSQTTRMPLKQVMMKSPEPVDLHGTSSMQSDIIPEWVNFRLHLISGIPQHNRGT